MLSPDPEQTRRARKDRRSLYGVGRLLAFLITLTLFVLTCLLMWVVLAAGYWVGLVLLLPAVGFLIHLYTIRADWVHEERIRRGRPSSH